MDQWDNEPANWEESTDGVVVDVEGDTDVWRVTGHGPDHVRDNAHFYHRTVSGDFTASLEIAGEYDSHYDQAGLMVRADDETWLKCGVEYVDGVQQASAVVTREFSDWSVVPLPDDPESVWIRVEREGPTVVVSFSRDGDEYTMFRKGYLTGADELRVGLQCAAPQGSGFRARFANFAVE